ncbi:hypothetical protein RJ639_011879 [Escallonia herrerae]|uniref:Protein kinase domain-containing protein n=1 Tax=Escallonia herrerae TaxID=1293975 RepID=A0AA88VJA9_9ASTE|nr:hypothetical protein RJ639_011879 [Escallonia herrerae]
MAHQEELESHTNTSKTQYPLDPSSYKILAEVGRGLSAVVYKAACLPVNAAAVAIKSIDLDRSKADFDRVRRESQTMSLLSHPNILKAHCSFTVGRRLWVVMPFMSAGSVQSIISSSFPNGLPEPCIGVVLKETLTALCYLHDQGNLHRDIKAGNILIDSNGCVKLADFGVSASIYELKSVYKSLSDITGTLYWMAPEVIHSQSGTGYDFKADIWSFGITALELAHGRPPLSHLPFSKSLIMKITRRFRFSDYEDGANSDKNRKFSKAFKDMVGLCLDQDPSKRPSAEKLLKHSFFRSCNKGCDFLVKNLLQGLPSVEERFKEKTTVEENCSEGFCLEESVVKQRRISGWNFNLEGFELEPVFPSERFDIEDEVVKQVRFGGDMIIREKGGGESSDASNSSSPGQVLNGGGGGGGVDREGMVGSLVVLKKSLEDQREKVVNMIGILGGGGVEEGSNESSGEMISLREEQLMQVIEKLRMELDNEKKKNFELGLELEFLKLQLSSTSD